MWDEPRGDFRPGRVDRDQGDGEDNHHQAEEAVGAFDPLERQDPHRCHQHGHARDRQERVRQARQIIEDQRHSAHLGGTSDESADERADQCNQPQLEAEAVAHQAKHRLPGDRRHAPAHLAEHAHADRAEHEHPNEGIAEHGTGLGGKDELADVDEPADSGHDPERQLKRIQGYPRSA